MKPLKLIGTLAAGMLLMLLALSGIAQAQPAAAQPARARAADAPILSLTYAYVVTGNVPVYASPADESIGLPPVRTLGAGYLWVSLFNSRPIEQGGKSWYQINKGEYVRAADLQVYRPSIFHGVTLSGTPDKPFGWMVYSVRVSAAAGEPAAKDALLMNRYTPITVFEEQTIDGLIWYRIGDNQWVDQKSVGLVFPAARPEGVGPTDKWIDINLFEQTLAAYEGDRMVYATLVSSGLPYWSTNTGLFRIWSKVKLAKMSGRTGLPDYYYLEDVPWAMYFDGDIALHTAYWHDRFGFKHSHGCVNLPPADAKWLFDWTTPTVGNSNWTTASAGNPGTWVWAHN
jgi:hypothetical protein